VKDWTGNKHSTFSTLGASNHSEYERAEHDFYATSPEAIKLLYLKYWGQIGFSNSVWECACGNGHLVDGLHEVAPHISIFPSDIIVRDFPCSDIDFLKVEQDYKEKQDIITNPPYKYAVEFCEKAIDLVDVGYKVAMFLKLTFLEGQKRREFFDKYPPKYILVFSKRVQVAINGDKEMFKKSSAACYAWFIWEKGFVGKPTIDWI